MPELRPAPSRRRILRDLALIGGGAALFAAVSASGPAVAKVSQGDVGYQPSPKGDSRCATCVNWQGANTCKVVSGSISPNGWCSLYSKKS